MSCTCSFDDLPKAGFCYTSENEEDLVPTYLLRQLTVVH